MLKSIIGNLLLSPDAPQSTETPPPAAVETTSVETPQTTGEEVPEGAPAGEEREVVTVPEEEEGMVTLDEFLNVKSKPQTTDDLGSGKPAKLPKDEKKEEGTEGTPLVKKEGKELGAKDQQGQPIKKFPAARDYTGIAEADVPMFQRMSNEAYEKFRPIYDQHKQLTTENAQLKEQVAKGGTAGQLPPSYYDHPNAYTLTPEYNQAVLESQEAAAVLEHWRTQLDEVRNGAQEYQTLVRDPRTGQILLGAKIPVDMRSQSQLENIFMNANSQANQYQQKIGVIRDGFARTHQAAIKDLSDYEKAFFSPYEDGKHPLVPAIKDTLNQMHPAFRSNPLAPFVAKSIVTINALLRQLQTNGQKTPQDKVKDKVTAAQRKAGPIATGAAAAPSKSDEGEVTMDDYLKVKES